MSVRLDGVPDRGLKIRTVRPKSRRMATLLYSPERQRRPGLLDEPQRQIPSEHLAT